MQEAATGASPNLWFSKCAQQLLRGPQDVCVWVVKSRRMRWAGHVAHMEERRGVYRVLVGKLEEKREPGVDGRIIVRWIFRKWDVGVWIGSSWLRMGTGGGQL